MIGPELHARIRRLFFAEHWRVTTIATQLGVHHDTVRRVIDSARCIRPGRQVRPSTLDPYKAFITATLEQYPRLRATRLWAMVRERGYPGSAIQRVSWALRSSTERNGRAAKNEWRRKPRNRSTRPFSWPRATAQGWRAKW